MICIDVELEFETEETIVCPFCKKKSTHTIKGVATGDIEPPERDED